jgi:hypothetical protein
MLWLCRFCFTPLKVSEVTWRTPALLPGALESASKPALKSYLSIQSHCTHTTPKVRPDPFRRTVPIRHKKCPDLFRATVSILPKKTSLKYEKGYFVRQNLSFSLPVPPVLLLGDATRWLLVGLSECSGGRISFPCQYHSTLFLHVHISTGGWTIGPFVTAVQRRSLTPSTWSLSTYD